MFRFTIRELVLVTVIVAMGMGWWLDRRAQFSAARSRTREHQAEVAQLESEIANLNNLISQIRLMNEFWKSRQQSALEESPNFSAVSNPLGQ